MKRLAGLLIGVVYAALSAVAFSTSRAGWAGGHSDLGLWWAVIGSLLAIAGLGAVIGVWIHTRPVED